MEVITRKSSLRVFVEARRWRHCDFLQDLREFLRVAVVHSQKTNTPWQSSLRTQVVAPPER
eukprot:14908610-Alexandrium_andersonii.AAC.1